MILICSENRKEFGFGHRSRALTLIEHFECLDIRYIYLITDIEWWEEMKLKKKSVKFISNSSGDLAESGIIISMIRNENLPIRLVFCDGNRFSYSFLQDFKDNNIKTVLIDDLGYPIRDNIYALWNPNIYANKEIYTKWKVNHQFLGAEFLLIRREFFSKKKTKRLKKIFISQGGIVREKIQRDIEEVLSSFNLSFEVANNYNVQQMIKAFDASLLVICGASVTLHEAWVRDAYTLPLYRSDDQYFFSIFLEENNIPFITQKKNIEKNFKFHFKELMYKILNKPGFIKLCQYNLSGVQNKSLKQIEKLYFIN